MTSDNAVCTLHITDTGGSHSFPAMVKLAIQRGQAFILVYSVTSRPSFDKLKTYYSDIISLKQTLNQTPLMIVGNKCDLHERQVTESEGQRLAKEWKCSFIETSAKQKYHTTDLFEQLLLLEKRQTMSLQPGGAKKRGFFSRVNNSNNSKETDNVKTKCLLM